VNYGNLALLFGVPAGTPMNLLLGNPVQLGDAPVGTSISGIWAGDPEGHVYHHQNTVDNTSYAAYTQGTYTFNETWALTVGVRWAQDEKEAYEDRCGYFEFGSFFALPGQTALSTTNIFMGNAIPSGDPNNPIIPLCALDDPNCATPLRLTGVPISYNSVVEDEDTWDDVTWRVNLDWTPTPDILMYGSVTTGYRAGGYSLGVTSSRDAARDPVTGLPVAGAQLKPLTYDEETVVAYEVGYKGIHFDGQLQVFASIYLYDYEGYQDRVDAFDAVRQSAVDVVQNAGDAQNMGFEIEATWLATDALTIGGNYSYTQTEYQDDYFVLDFQNPAVPTGVFGAIGPNGENAQYYITNVNGNDLKRIPDHKYTIWASYDFVFDWGTITANGTWAYSGDFQSTPLDRAIDRNPERENLDLALIWRDSRDRFVVRGFVDNVFDDVGTRGINASGGDSNYRRSGEIFYPRYAGIDVTWRFGAFY
jgi:iron complex outermembrane receptor protein